MGFAIGLVLSAMGFAATNLGHGTYVLILANVPLLGFGKTTGVIIALLAAPFVWLLYFIFIPKIRTPVLRSSVVAVIALLHFITLFWSGSKDYMFDRGLQTAFGGVLLYVAALGSAIGYLGFVAAKVAGRQDPEP